MRVSLVAAAGGSPLGTGRVKARYGGERLLVSVRLTAAGRRALARARGLARYRFVIRAVDRAGNARRVPVRRLTRRGAMASAGRWSRSRRREVPRAHESASIPLPLALRAKLN